MAFYFLFDAISSTVVNLGYPSYDIMGYGCDGYVKGSMHMEKKICLHKHCVLVVKLTLCCILTRTTAVEDLI